MAILMSFLIKYCRKTSKPFYKNRLRALLFIYWSVCRHNSSKSGAVTLENFPMSDVSWVAVECFGRDCLYSSFINSFWIKNTYKRICIIQVHHGHVWSITSVACRSHTTIGFVTCDDSCLRSKDVMVKIPAFSWLTIAGLLGSWEIPALVL